MTTYSYINVPDLTAASDTKTDYSVAGRAGFFTSQLGFVIGSAAYQRTSSAGADGVSLCRPVVGTAATSCSDAVLKPPNQSDSYMLSLQLRRALTGDVFVAPAVQHDVRKHVTSVLVPIYFLKDSKGTPIGGLRGGWRSDTHDVSVVLFVGAGFVLTP